MKSRLRPQPTFPTVTTLAAIEWEELPSLAGHLVGHLHAATAGAEAPGWEVTLPASLDAALTPEPFRETVHGLAVREVREPEVFRHFFGKA